MKFAIDIAYIDRVGKIYIAIDHWNTLPTFKDEFGKLFVRNINGKYRWDDKEDERDIIDENIL